MFPPKKPDAMPMPMDATDLPADETDEGEADPEAILSALDQMTDLVDSIKAKMVTQRKAGGTPPPDAGGV